jgi:hypothetical protein
MKILRTYETTIMSGDSEHAVQVLVVPRRSMPPNVSLEPRHLFEELNLGKICAVDASNLAHYLAVLASPELPQTELPEALSTAVKAPTYQPTKDDVRFAEMISFDRLIPFEESPLELESLAKLATTASGLALFVGFVVFGPSPLLLIALPTGIVLCGAARGIGQGLEEGLRDKIRDWIKGETAKKEKRRRVEVPRTRGRVPQEEGPSEEGPAKYTA